MEGFKWTRAGRGYKTRCVRTSAALGLTGQDSPGEKNSLPYRREHDYAGGFWLTFPSPFGSRKSTAASSCLSVRANAFPAAALIVRNFRARDERHKHRRWWLQASPMETFCIADGDFLIFVYKRQRCTSCLRTISSRGTVVYTLTVFPSPSIHNHKICTRLILIFVYQR